MPTWSDAAPQDESHRAEPPENKSTMTPYQKLSRSPSPTPRAASDPITPSSLPPSSLSEIFRPSHPPSIRLMIKCCSDRLIPTAKTGHGSRVPALTGSLFLARLLRRDVVDRRTEFACHHH